MQNESRNRCDMLQDNDAESREEDVYNIDNSYKVIRSINNENDLTTEEESNKNIASY